MHNKISSISPYVWLILMILLTSIFAVLLYLQYTHLADLEEQLQTLRAQQNQRLINLEFIANAHTEHLRNIDLNIYDLQETQADHDWRIRENAWDLQAP